MKFGIGNWAKIIDCGSLPGKTNAQMNLQLQRLLGQQSTAGKIINISVWIVERKGIIYIYIDILIY